MSESRPSFVAAVDRQGKAPDGQRWRTAFVWELVDPDLLRHVIAAAGAEHVAALRDLDRDALASVAQTVFGAQVPQRAMGRVGPVLIEYWLPVSRDDSLARLTQVTQTALGKAYRDQQIRGRDRQIAFLQDRRRTKNFYDNLREAFHREHRGSWLISKGSAGEQAQGVFALRGAGRDPDYDPYPHTLAAWNELDRLDRAGPVRGLVVLPTGAGKTDVAVGWLLRRMEREPDLRVLWIAHQVSLLDQAATRFAATAPEQARAFSRTLRIFAGGREPTSLLDRRKTDVACATIQTISRRLDRRSRRRTEVSNFLKGPTVVIVDEAHHVASRSYQLLMEFVADPEIHDVVGLTATPWGQGERQDRIDEAFPQPVISRSREELIEAGVLAAYTVVPVRTRVAITVTADERAEAERLGDLPLTVLRKLETDERNAAVLQTYLGRARDWGRTLLFTTTIDNAEDLALRLKEHGANARALHSQSEDTLAALKPWFATHDDAVIVSVGMLLEGVDLPKARTALIARATTSRNVLSQMVGRVLRGVAAGGEATANVVYMVDDWDDFTGVLTPTGAWEGGAAEPERPEAQFPADIAAAIAAALQPEHVDLEAVRDWPAIEVALEQRRLVGFYEVLDDATVPVFDHQYELLTEYLERGGGGFTWPADAPPPAVVDAHLELLDEFVTVHGAAPRFVPFARSIAPLDVARTLSDDTPRTRAEQRALIAAAYEDAFTQAVYPTLRHFEEAVNRRLGELERPRPVEAPLPVDNANRAPLPRNPRRSLEPTLDLVMDRAEILLPPTRRVRLVRPEVRWSDTVTRAYLAMWSLGDTPSEHRIVVNALLRTDEAILSEEVLGFLIWHELVHSVTPGQGHDAEFEELEMRWPNAAECNADLDALVRDWSANPRDYA